MSKSTKPDHFKHMKQRVYMSPEVIGAFDKLCELEGKSRSQVLTQLAKARIRAKSKKLRAANYVIPQEVFEK